MKDETMNEETAEEICEECECEECECECEDCRADENARLSAKNEELTALLQRVQADFDNYRRRTNETNKTVRDDGRKEVLEKLLPLADALEAAKKIITDEKVKEGVDLIVRKLEEIFSSYGIVKIDALGKPFDPNFHEAIMQRDAGEENSDTVVEVFREGYMMGNRVLRHSSVIVGQ